MMRRKGRKNFFFEKKKQKTFMFFGALCETMRLTSESFLAPFFKKEHASSLSCEPLS
jgi:hypothetical protein